MSKESLLEKLRTVERWKNVFEIRKTAKNRLLCAKVYGKMSRHTFFCVENEDVLIFLKITSIIITEQKI